MSVDATVAGPSRASRRLPAMVVLVLLAGLLALAPSSADASVEMALVSTLPQSHDGELLVLPDQRVAIAGGAGAPVVLYDDATRKVSPVPGTEGAIRLDVDADEQHLTAVSPDPARVYSISLDDLSVRAWDVPGQCPYDATSRGGRIWVLVTNSGCAPGLRSHGTLQVLDPATGAVTPASAPQEGLTDGIVGGSVVGLRGAAIVVGGWTVPNWGPTVLSRRFDVVRDGLSQTATAELTSDVHLTDDGTRVYGAETLDSGHYVRSVDASTLADAITYGTPCGPHQQVGQEVTIGTRGDGLCMQRRTPSGTSAESFTPPGPATSLRGALLASGSLVAAGSVDGTRRIYRTDSAEPATAGIRTRWWGGVTGVGEPYSVDGYVIGLQPEPGQAVELVDRDNASVVLDRATLSPDGTWTSTFELDQPGLHLVQARLQVDGRTITEDYELDVLEHHRTVRFDEAIPLARGGEPVVVTGAAYDNGDPRPGIVVSLRRSVGSPFGRYPVDLGTVTTDDQGRFRHTAPGDAADAFGYLATVLGSDGSAETDETIVAYERRPSTVGVGPIEGLVMAGTPFDVPVRVTGPDGEPVGGMSVRTESDETGDPYPHAVTDSDGRAVLRVVREHRSTDAPQGVVVWSSGDDTYRNDYGTAVLYVALNPTTLRATAPDTAEIGEVITVSGQVSCAVNRVRTVTVGWPGTVTQITTTVTTDEDGRFSTPYYFLNRASTLPVSVAADGFCASEGIELPVEMPQSQVTITGTFPSTAPRYVGVQVVGHVGNGDPCRGPGLEVLVDGEVVQAATADRCTYDYTYVPAGAIGEEHELEVRYSGTYDDAPASRTWTVTTVAPQPVVHVDAPQHVFADGRFRITGRLEQVPPGEKTGLIRTPYGDSQRVSVDRDGSFSAMVRTSFTPDDRLRRWTVLYEGVDGEVPSARGWVARAVESAPIRLSIARSSLLPGGTATIAVQPEVGHSGHVVVEHMAYGESVVWASGEASPNYPLTVSRRINGTTYLRVSVSEGSPWGPTYVTYQVWRYVYVQLALTTTMVDPVRRVDRYSVYPRGTNPRIRTIDRTPEAGRCLRSQVQRRGADGRWTTVLDRRCDPESAAGYVGFRFTGARVAGARFRVRSLATDERYLASPSAWAYFRFR